jgi:hypothetical protein
VNANQQDLDDDDQVSLTWSRWRIGLVAGGTILSVLALVYLGVYAIRVHPKPSELGISNVLFVGLGIVAVLVIPWKELGFVPTEIAGLVKFERIVNTQKQEQIAAIVPLQADLKDLKNKYESIVNALAISNPGFMEEHKLLLAKEETKASTIPAAASGSDSVLDRPAQLNALLLKFFRKYRGSFFNPIRIQHWGGARTGFSKLGNFSTDEIEQALFKGVADKTIDTMVTNKGSTLYGLSWSGGRG